MDLRLFWGVVKRYKRLSIGGALLAVILAVLAYGTPSLSGGFPTVVPRGSVTYASDAQLLITQPTGVYGRLANDNSAALQDPGYLSTLSPIYAGLATGNSVQAAIRAAKVPGALTATGGVDPNTGDYLPFVNVTATGPTPQDAATLSKIGIASLQAYAAKMEADSAVPANERIYLEVIKTGPPVLASGHKVMIPLLVLVAVFTGLITLLFSLENHDPQTAAALGRVPASVAPVAPPNGVTPRRLVLSAEPGAQQAGPPDGTSQSGGETPETRLPVRERLMRR